MSNIIAAKGAKGSSLRESKVNRLYKDDRSFRADHLVEGWSQVPEIGEGLDELDTNTARNTAINLDLETKFLKGLRESQLALATDGEKPENMVRMVRLTMPSAIRNQIFTEFAMESAKDSMKYMRAVVDKSVTGNNMSRHHSNGDFGDTNNETDPYDIENNGLFNGDSYQKALYEMSEDRFTQEVANALILEEADTVYIGEKKVELAAAEGVTPKFVIVFGKKDKDRSSEFDLGYIDGYVTIFGENEQDTIAQQYKQNKEFMISSKYAGVKIVPATDADGKEVRGAFFVLDPDGKLGDSIKAYGRYNSEADFEGQNLGELKLKISTYDFEPRPIAIGMSFSNLAEFSLNASFGVSIDEEMLTCGSQELKASMDRQAFRIAYHAAKTNPKGYVTVFDAGWDKTASKDSNQKRGYIENAQTFPTALAKVSDVQMNDINRGGVTSMVGGPSACSYQLLIKGFEANSETGFVGPHKFGALNNIPVYKVQSSIIPTNEILTVWNNTEYDVSVIFGTLIPFFSTGLIQRKNFYVESAMATFGDYNVLNRRYLGLIRIKNLAISTDDDEE